MALNATITGIALGPDGTGSGVNWQVIVLFSDSISGFNQTKTYAFPNNQTIQGARTAIQGDLSALQGLVTQSSSLQQYVGTVLS